MRTLINGTVILTSKERLPYKRFFAQRGASVLMQNKTGISRFQVYRMLQTGRITTKALEAVNEFMEQHELLNAAI